MTLPVELAFLSQTFEHFLARGERLSLAARAGLFVMLTLLQLAQNPRLLALALEPSQRVLQGLVFSDLYQRHPFLPSLLSGKQMPCPPLPGSQPCLSHPANTNAGRGTSLPPTVPFQARCWEGSDARFRRYGCALVAQLLESRRNISPHSEAVKDLRGPFLLVQID